MRAGEIYHQEMHAIYSRNETGLKTTAATEWRTRGRALPSTKKLEIELMEQLSSTLCGLHLNDDTSTSDSNVNLKHP